MKTLKLKANFKNFIAYLLVWLVNLWMFFYLHSYFNFLFMILLGLLPLVSIIMAIIAVNKIELEYIGANEEMHIGEEFLFEAKLINKSPIPILNVWIDLAIENSFLGVSGKHTLNSPAFAFKDNEIKYNLTADYIGIYRIKTDYIEVSDWFNIARIRVDNKASKEYTILPSNIIDLKISLSAAAAGMTESVESHKGGYDFSEVFEVREYIPGDRLNNIHWKLTAKKGDLMVKDRESMSAEELVLIVDLYCPKNEEGALILSDIVTAAIGAIRFFMENKIPLKVVYLSGLQDDIVMTYIGNNYELINWIKQVYYETPGETVGLAREMYVNSRNGEDAKAMVIGIMEPGIGAGNIVFEYENAKNNSEQIVGFIWE